MSGKDEKPPETRAFRPDELAEIRAALVDALDPGDSPDMTSEIMSLLGLDSSEVRIGPLLRKAQEQARAIEIANPVLARLGLVDGGEKLGSTLRLGEGVGNQRGLDKKVAERLGVENGNEIEALLREGISLEAANGIEAGVLSRLELVDDTEEVSQLLREWVGEEACPDLTDAVMAELGMESDLSIRELLAPEATPDLWGAISDEISLSDRVASERIDETPITEAPVLSFESERRKRRAWIGATAIWAAAAAALLFVFVNEPSSPLPAADDMPADADAVAMGIDDGAEGDTASWASSSEAEGVASVDGEDSEGQKFEEGDVIIEELGSEANAFVQVLQFEEDAPPIIFITELDDSEEADLDEATL